MLLHYSCPSRSLVKSPELALLRFKGEFAMSAQASVLDLNPKLAVSPGTWRSRSLAIILMLAIAGVFWVDSRYPALLKRYHAGTQIKASGALTFGQVYAVDRSMPLSARVW